MKLTKTEEALLAQMRASARGTVHVQMSNGWGCRKGGEGHRAYGAATKLIKRGLARVVSRDKSVDYHRGRSTHLYDLVIELVKETRP